MHKTEILTLQSNFSTYWAIASEVEETFHRQQPTATLLKFTGLWYRKFYVHNYYEHIINEKYLSITDICIQISNF